MPSQEPVTVPRGGHPLLDSEGGATASRAPAPAEHPPAPAAAAPSPPTVSQSWTQSDDAEKGLSLASLRSNRASHVAMQVNSQQVASVTMFVAVGCVAISPILFGYSLGFTSPVQDTMIGKHVNVTATPPIVAPNGLVVFESGSQYSHFSAIINIGAVLGAFGGSYLSDKIGRKRTLSALSVMYCLPYVGMAMYSSPLILYGSRFLLGLAVGAGSAVTPTYISEIATTSTRGALGTVTQLSVNVGILAVNMVGGYWVVDINGVVFCKWRTMAAFGALMSLVLLVMAVMPESPKWLSNRGRRTEARRSLERLRANDASLELAALFAYDAPVDGPCYDDGAVPSPPAPPIGYLLTTYWKSFEIAIGLLVFQQLSGINAVVFYTKRICEDVGMADPAFGAQMATFVMVFVTASAVGLMDRLGRKTLLLAGLAAMTSSLFLLAYHFLTVVPGNKETGEPSSGGLPSAVALGALFLYISAFSFSMGPIPWLIVGEVAPTEVVGTVSAVGIALNWMFSFIVTLTFDSLAAALGPQGCFGIFGALCGVCFWFVLLKVPETAGLAIAEVLEVLGIEYGAGAGGAGGAREVGAAVARRSHR